MNRTLNILKENSFGIASSVVLCFAFPGCFPLTFFAGGVGVGISLWTDLDVYFGYKEAILIGSCIGFLGGISSLLSVMWAYQFLFDIFSNALTPQIQARFLASLNKHGDIFNQWVGIHIMLCTVSSTLGATSTLEWFFSERKIPNDL